MVADELAELCDVMRFLSFPCSLKIDECDLVPIHKNVFERPRHLLFVDVQQIQFSALFKHFFAEVFDVR